MIELTVTQTVPLTDEERAKHCAMNYGRGPDEMVKRQQLLQVSLTEEEWTAVKRGVLEVMK